MRLFITGSTGVIGRRVIPVLIARGDEVTAVARSPEKAAALERQGCRPVMLDLFDATAVRRAVDGQHTVVNLATHIPTSTAKMFMRGAWKENDRIRHEGSRILSDAAVDAGVARFIQESFAPIYQTAGDDWIDESSFIQAPRYAQTVLDAEEAAHRVTGQRGVGIVLRFGAFYGPDSSFTGDFVKALRMRWSPVPGSPNAFFSSVSHDDAASAVVAALDIPAGDYNVVDDQPLRRGDLMNGIAKLLGVGPPRFVPRWVASLLMGSLGEVLTRSLRISNKKLKSASSWTPKYPNAIDGWKDVIPHSRSE